ncbi:MAG: hypothetical protein ACYTFY_19765 [Planctomycetota bacterium]|jgi:uncharacterized protein (DUF1015 family)
MPYTLNYKNKGFFLQHTGLVTVGEINEVNGLIHGHEMFDEHRFQVIDLLGADFSQVDLTQANEPGIIDSVASKTNSKVKVAIVATDEQTIKFCKGYINSAIQSGIEWIFKMFTDMDSALQWVDIEQGTTE